MDRPDLGRLGVRALSFLPPERAHALALFALRRGLLPPQRAPDDPILAVNVFGIDFPNPVGVAAGFDKNAEAVAPMLAQGAGFVEVGGVTPKPQPGNPRPRLFRLPADRAVINRLGLNSAGIAAVRARLERFRSAGPQARGVVGVNLGMNKESADPAADYAAGAAAFAPLADFLVVNVSSPNTPGLRDLQAGERLARVLARVDAALAAVPRRPPLLVKVAPDLAPGDRETLAATILAAKGAGGWPVVQGLVCGNTTVSRPADLAGRHRGEAGGLSGRPLFRLSTEVLADFRRLTGGRLPLIGVGGVASGADAYAKIRAGASLVQLYTAMVYEGPGLIRRIKRDLAALLRADGFGSVAEAVGADRA